jgi:hypothetical protein
MSASSKTKRASPFSIRFSDDEIAALRAKAAGMPLGTYVRVAVLGGEAVGPAHRRARQVQDAEPLGRLLGLLGQSHLASNLNQLARAANQGALPLTVEVEDDLKRACAEVAEMRGLLLQALGIRKEAPAGAPVIRDAFQANAGSA